MPLRRTVLLLTAVLLAACGGDDRNLPTLGGEPAFTKEGTLDFVAPDGRVLRTIDVEIAETDAEQQRGMMGRRSMPPNSGMLFLFSRADTNGFWMKNTPLPLDILFFGPDSQLVRVAHRTRPFSEQTILPGAPKQFVVELRGGMAERWGIGDSTRIRWRRL